MRWTVTRKHLHNTATERGRWRRREGWLWVKWKLLGLLNFRSEAEPVERLKVINCDFLYELLNSFVGHFRHLTGMSCEYIACDVWMCVGLYGIILSLSLSCVPHVGMLQSTAIKRTFGKIFVQRSPLHTWKGNANDKINKYLDEFMTALHLLPECTMYSSGTHYRHITVSNRFHRVPCACVYFRASHSLSTLSVYTYTYSASGQLHGFFCVAVAWCHCPCPCHRGTFSSLSLSRSKAPIVRK